MDLKGVGFNFFSGVLEWATVLNPFQQLLMQRLFMRLVNQAMNKLTPPTELNISNVGHDAATIGVLLIPAGAREKDRPASEEVNAEIIKSERVS